MIRFLPNALSIARFLLGGVFAVMLAIRSAGKTIPVWNLVLCFLAIVLSDLLDGWLSRRFNCQSELGAVLDVSADSFFLLLSLIVSNYYGLVPVWFTMIVILKLADFILSSIIFSAEGNRHFIFDFLGRFTVVGFYFLPILVGISPQSGFIKIAAIFLAITAVCSSILRWFSFTRKTEALKAAGTPSQEE